MPDDKSWNALVVGSALTLVFNGVMLGADLACHAIDLNCDYQFEAVGLTMTSTDTVLVMQQPSAVIRST